MASEAEKKEQTQEHEPIIEVTNLVKCFGRRRVLDGINMKVYKGQTAVIMGGSGCGKSTLLRCLIGAYRPDEGEIKLFGKDIAKMDEHELNEVRKRFGVVFQSAALYKSMTVGENVALPLREHYNLDENIIRIIVKIKLELVHMRDFESYMPSQLSGGMQKRVGIARAIAMDPEIVFYDEPTAGLDPIVTSHIDHLIMDLSKKLHVTSVVVTHDMASAFRIADRIFVLKDGKFVEEGTPEEVKNSKDEFVQQFITGKPDGPVPLSRSASDFLEDLIGE